MGTQGFFGPGIHHHMAMQLQVVGHPGLAGRQAGGLRHEARADRLTGLQPQQDVGFMP